MVKDSVPINIPNTITLLRILLTPLFVIFLMRQLFGFALLVFAIAAVSDGLDGLVARLFRKRTTLGAYLDPAADKLLLVTAFVTLAVQGYMPGWMAVIAITRDILILFGIALFIMIGSEFHPRPSILSKITTVAQLAFILAVLGGNYDPRIIWLEEPTLWFAAAMTMISGFQYIYMGLNILQKEP